MLNPRSPQASRTFLVGTDLNEYSVHALNWLLSSLTEDHDEIVVLRVIEPASGVTLSERQLEECREEAEEVLKQVMSKNGPRRQISIIVEFAIGPIEETIHRCVHRVFHVLIRPIDSLYTACWRYTNPTRSSWGHEGDLTGSSRVQYVVLLPSPFSQKPS